MSKKIVSLLLMLLVAFSCTMTAFCTEAQEAPAETETLEEAPIAEAVPEDIAIEPVIPALEAEEDPAVTATATYDEKEKKFHLTVKNTSSEDVIVSSLAMHFDDNQMKLKLSDGSEIPSMAAQLQLGEIPAMDEVTITMFAEIAEGAAPKMSVDMKYISNSAMYDLTQEGATKSAYIENVFGEASGKVSFIDAIKGFLGDMGFAMIANNWKVLIMILISFVLMYLAIVKKFEPLLLLPIAFGMLLTNLPGAEMYHTELFSGGHVHWDMFAGKGDITPGLIDYLYLGVKLGIYPCLIFVGVGAMTDFGPLIANPKSLLLGAAAQLGIFLVFFGTRLIGFNPLEAASTGIIGGADGPTAIFVTSKLAPDLLGPIAVAAYSYMALVPVIQPPIMKLLTTKKERQIVMKQLRPVSKTEKIIFPIVVTTFVALLLPSAAPLIGCLMLGNLLTECGVTERLSKTVQNELMNIVTIFLGISVGATATAEVFLTPKTLAIIAMGIVAFGCGTAGGVLLAKLMNLFTKNKINPLIGSAGVSAVPMAARVSQVVGQKENPKNFLLMHAMGPNVAGVIGSAIAAGAFLTLFMK